MTLVNIFLSSAAKKIHYLVANTSSHSFSYPSDIFSILIKRVHYIILKVNINSLVFVSFSHFFLRRCKYYCVYLSDLYFCFDYPPQVSLLQHVWFVCFCSKSLILKHIMCIFSFSNLNNLSCGNHFLQQTSTSGLTNSQYSLNLFSAD